MNIKISPFQSVVREQVASMKEQTSAFSTLANGGEHHGESYLIEKIELSWKCDLPTRK